MWPRLALFFAVFSLGMLLAGCDNTIEPVLDQTDEVFTLHGFLDSAADTQFVRIAQVRPTILPGDGPIDATVRSIHLETGATTTWTGMPFLLEDSTMGVRFHAAFAPVAGGTYRLEVRRADGAMTHAVTRLPTLPAVRLGPVEGSARNINQAATVLGLAKAPNRLGMAYEVSLPGRAPELFEIDYGTLGTLAGGGWQLTVRLKRDQETILFRLRRDVEDRSVRLHGLGLTVALLSEEWAAPEAEANIENGHGFFGAVGRYVLPWTLAPADVADLGFVDAQ